MRSIVCLILAISLPLVAFSQTNEWEAEGIAGIESIATNIVAIVDVKIADVKIADVDISAGVVDVSEGVDITETELDAETELDVVDVSAGVTAYALAFEIMGSTVFYAPHPQSAFGIRYRLLGAKMKESSSWVNDPAIVAEWEAYHRAVKSVLSRKANTR